MTTLEFKIEINATPEKLWESLWEIENYKRWTNTFCEGSHYRTDSFAEGSKIHLLSPDGQGMYSILEKVSEPYSLTLRHIGELKNFEEVPVNDTTQSWTNAIESYQIEPTSIGVELTARVDTVDEYIDYMKTTFPKALDELKKIAEGIDIIN